MLVLLIIKINKDNRWNDVRTKFQEPSAAALEVTGGDYKMDINLIFLTEKQQQIKQNKENISYETISARSIHLTMTRSSM
jgi:hypothetical protein